LIPYFKDKQNVYQSLDILVNNDIDTNNIVMNFNVDMLEEGNVDIDLSGRVRIPVDNTASLGLDSIYAGAAKTLANVKEPNATTAYLKAVVAARTNDKAAVLENLKSAIAQDASLKARAAQDIEFAKFAEEAEFQAIVK
jgi:hypothetical protein